MAESSQQCEENEQKSYEYRLDDFLINLFFGTHIFLCTLICNRKMVLNRNRRGARGRVKINFV